VQIHRCDVCGTLGEPGMRWLRVNLSPFTIQPQNPSMEVPYYEELYLDICSTECARQRLVDFDFVTDNRKSLCKSFAADGLRSPTDIRPTLTEPVEPDLSDFPDSRMGLAQE
jgi:hypothetical protein